MIYGRMTRPISSLLICSMLFGCMHFDKELHYLGDADLDYYKDQTTTIDYVNVATETPQEVIASHPPRTLRDRHKDEIWDMTLAEAIQLAMENNRIIRTRGQFQGPVTLSDQTASVYDPAIQESGVLFGGRGVEAALADFDAQFSTSMLWGRNETVQNNIFFSGGLTGGTTLQQDSGVFESSLQKQFGYGGSMTLAHDWTYNGLNIPTQLFPSNYSGNVRAEYRQPLWAGSGTEFTRIAGPLNPNFGGITGVSQGVVIARINSDISLADFEANVRNMLKDVEDIYWDLYLSYQIYRTAVVSRNSALKTWRDAEVTDREGGIDGFDKADVPQARDQYFARKANTELALNDIYNIETELRRILGLAVNDGTIIRPADEPTRAEFIPDWHTSLAESLSRRVELRKQKWNIKSLELQYQAAKSLTNPQLDFVSRYQVNGFGDHLFGQNDNDGITPQGLASAYETITQGNQTGWNLGFVFSVPLGFRSANAQVRNYELRLAKAREVLATMEMDVAHGISLAFQNIAANHAAAQSNLNRQIAAQERVNILELQRSGGVLKADLVLRAQASRADAERSFYTSLVQYNQAITDFHFRKGTLLDHNNVFLSEDQWTPEAYRDAYRRAWARSHAIDSDRLLRTEPEEFVLTGGYTTAVQMHPVEDHGLNEDQQAVFDEPDESTVDEFEYKFAPASEEPPKLLPTSFEKAAFPPEDREVSSPWWDSKSAVVKLGNPSGKRGQNLPVKPTGFLEENETGVDADEFLDIDFEDH